MGDRVLAIAAIHNNDIFASGSAVLVAPHLALTARHVTDDFAERYIGIAARSNDRAPYAIIARCFSAGVWRIFHVLQTFNAAEIDLTALYVSLAPDEAPGFVWPRMTLDLLPPHRGSRVTSWGYVTPYANFEDVKRGVIHWHTALARSTGTVSDIFPRRRDRAIVNYPAFHFDARVDASMSGGPIFDETGRLVGINTRSLPAQAEGESHTSTAALLWPVPALPFAVRGEAYPDSTAVQCIEDLHRLGFLQLKNPNVVQVDRNTAAGEMHVSITIPDDRR